ncbi:hypothetical protein T492DRAFT_902014 [Pavlovales sp. CCMP2436]|nr:hypothetical protein T492DRAFT_902014 [Pavlovales sp. CCMP2436]
MPAPQGAQGGGGNGLPTVIFLALLLLRQASRWLVEVHVLSTPADQPLVTRMRDFLEPELLASLRRTVLEHPASTEEQQLNPTTFSKSRGFVLQFNRAGGERLREPASEFHFLQEFYTRSASNESNAFVMNVLVIPPTNQDDNESAVKLHFDDTVRVDSARMFLAHSVSVLYLQVPAEAEGGQLHVYDARGDGAYSAPADGMGDEVINPVDNKFVVFRGDALHRISAFHLSSGGERIDAKNQGQLRVSLVLEQRHLARYQTTASNS